jgi:hypothetical protein
MAAKSGRLGDPVRAQAVYTMKIHGDTGGRLTFDAIDAGLPELAWIAENGRSAICAMAIAGRTSQCAPAADSGQAAVTWAAGRDAAPPVASGQW